MRTIIPALIATSLLAACGEEAETTKPRQERAQSLQPGEYEVTSKVDAIRSTDNTTPATSSAVADPPKVTRTCVPADGTIDAAAFAEAGETCTASDRYMRGGRMSLQFKCRREGQGQLTQLVDGNFTADSFTGKVITGTYFAGSGDYEMTRTITGKRLGDCPAGPATEPAAGAQ